MADVHDRWTSRSAEVPGGRLEWTVFPGPRPFIGATRLDGKPTSPAEAHALLVEAGHEDAALSYMGEEWAADVDPRRPM